MGIGYASVDLTLPQGIKARNAILITPTHDGLRDITVDIELRRFDGLGGLPSLVRLPILAFSNGVVLPVLTGLVLLGLMKTIVQDLPIWENKTWLQRPALTPFDGPIESYRWWCKQFVPASYKAWFEDYREPE
jgi:hypothetical protein